MFAVLSRLFRPARPPRPAPAVASPKAIRSSENDRRAYAEAEADYWAHLAQAAEDERDARDYDPEYLADMRMHHTPPEEW